MEELNDEIQEAGEQAENSANGGYSVLGNVFANVITKGIELAGTALKNFTEDVITTGMEYESAISNVVAISGAMAEEVELLQEKAEEMGATTKFTASESAEAMGYMAMAGWKTEDMISGLDGIMNLASASGENLASVSDIVTDALTAFGLQASDSTHFADVLATASSNANTNVSMMGESFKYVAPVAGSMGSSIEDVAIALGLMANSGIKASQAGTSLKNALVNLVKPTDAQVSAMSSLGLAYTKTIQVFDDKAIEKAQENLTKKSRAYEDAAAKHADIVARYGEDSTQFVTATNRLENAFDDLQKAQEELATAQQGTTKEVLTGADAFTDEYGNMKSLREIMDALRSSLGAINVELTDGAGNLREYEDIIEEISQSEEGLTQSEQLKNAGILFGKQNLSGMLAIINAKQEDYDKLVEAIDNADGTSEEMSKTMLDNLQGDKTLLESAFDGMKIAISKEINPALRDLVQYATSQIPKIQAVAEPLFKGAVNGVQSLINGFQKIKPVLSAIKPLIAIVFADKTITLFINTLMPKAIDLLSKLLALLIRPIDLVGRLPLIIDSLPAKIAKIPTALASVGNAFKGLWAMISANPLTTAGIALAGVAFVAKSYIDNLEIEKTDVELLIEKHNEEIQALYDKRRAVEDLNDAFYENVDGIQTQTDRTRDLWNELDKLTDQYGNVQQKDKARAEYILNELNSALGTEYQMTGNQIENYRQLSAEIDNVIAKKQAEMMLDAYLANSTEMTKQRIEARTDYENANKDYNEKKKIVEEAEKDYEKATRRSADEITSGMSEYQIKEIAKSDEEYVEGYALLLARENLQQAENAKTQAKITYERTSEYFENLEQLQEAYSLGQYEKMSEIIFAEKDLTNITLDESATNAEQRLEIYSENLQKTLSDFELSISNMRQTSVDELEKTFKETMQSGAVAGVDPLETWKQFKDDTLKMQANGLDISPIINGLVDSGITPAQAFGNDWKDVFRTQLKNGGDMKSMLEWLNNSEYNASIPLVFGNDGDFLKYLKQQLENGQNVNYLLEWGVNSGLATSEEFVDIYKQTVEKNLDNGFEVGNLLEWGNTAGIDLGGTFGERYVEQMQQVVDRGADLTKFIQWAEANGKSAGEIFGENFQSELSNFIDFDKERKDEKIKNSFIFSFFSNENNLSAKLNEAFTNGENLSELAKKARKQGLNIGDVFGSDFMKVIQKQVNDGFDVEELVKWAEKTGGDIAEEYSDIYTKIIQKQLDNGYNIEKLLQWGDKSGIKTADMFGSKYTPEVQTFIDKGFSIDSLLEWARNAGYTAGQVFGENFQSVADGYMNSNEAKLEYLRQKIAESSSFGNFFFGNTRFMADGGFLSRGQAVVAEAGPELLEVMNGGVRVTPLTQNSRNTSVNSGQRIFYSTYTINATISNSYDVSRLAEDLETERRRIEMGMGKA